MVETVCEGDDFIFPWHFGDWIQATFVNLTFVNSKKEVTNLLQKLSIDGLMETRNQRLDYRSQFIILKDVKNNDRGLYVFKSRPAYDTYEDVSVEVISRQQGAILICILVYR